ncbi:CPBP family intramembrane glutamic endopeptidase [Phaeobacter sp. 11ANDIMAR09]|uniref:CPBP family intramembrane glutamic endopeptidase n=1 Tax=Phaeobacter sp. 11ANDIMAR09 TaxID=1225647 RepID=UPI0006C83833|nr:CPBP family intramembrane glutamic endopeptidase [Phaeobacter sp. 11ANDIMAR09]KPD13311.1 CAAX protease [Phaeobacter sp. 11ANDIMAR09]
MSQDPVYPAHEALVAPGRSRPEVWRLLLGLGVIVLVSYGLNLVTFLGLLRITSLEWLIALEQGRTPLALLILLATFGFLTLGVALAARLLQNRSLLSLIGRPGLMLQQFILCGLAGLAVFATLFLLPPYDFGVPLVANLSWPVWLGLLPLSLLAVLVQVSAEELVFRGYLQQGLAARFQSPLIWLGLPAALFGAAHYMPQVAGDNALLICLWAMGFGLLMADLTARAGTMGPAIAVHFANNFVALLIFGSPSSLHGLALYLLPYEMSDVAAMRPWLIVDCATMLVLWLAARLAIRR